METVGEQEEQDDRGAWSFRPSTTTELEISFRAHDEIVRAQRNSGTRRETQSIQRLRPPVLQSATVATFPCRMTLWTSAASVQVGMQVSSSLCRGLMLLVETLLTVVLVLTDIGEAQATN